MFWYLHGKLGCPAMSSLPNRLTCDAVANSHEFAPPAQAQRWSFGICLGSHSTSTDCTPRNPTHYTDTHGICTQLATIRAFAHTLRIHESNMDTYMHVFQPNLQLETRVLSLPQPRRSRCVRRFFVMPAGRERVPLAKAG